MSLPIIIALAAGAYILTSGKKGSSSTPCPANLKIDISNLKTHSEEVVSYDRGATVTRTVVTPVEALRANDRGEKNPVTLAKIVMAPYIPRRCMENFDVIVSKDGDPNSYAAPDLVAILAADIGYDLAQLGRYSEEEELVQVANTIGWWNRIAPGKPFPSM